MKLKGHTTKKKKHNCVLDLDKDIQTGEDRDSNSVDKIAEAHYLKIKSGGRVCLIST